jgi:L-rhamnose isomerase / sugar isomerase
VDAGSAAGEGLAADPVAAYHASGYAVKIIADRQGGSPAGWGA